MDRTQQKIISILFCYMADITLMAWLYFRMTNYHSYTEKIGVKFDSPDFQLQLYQVLLQSLTFALLLFLVAQTIVYVLAWRNFRSAYLYLKFFAVFGFAISLYITVLYSLFAFVPLVIYLFTYYTFATLFTESSAIVQSLPQSPKQ